MTAIEFLSHRAAFAGLPYSELCHVIKGAETGSSWRHACGRVARRCRRLARAAQSRGSRTSATEAWQWTASAYQVASLGVHLEELDQRWMANITRLRRLATAAYRRRLAADTMIGEPVAIPCGKTIVSGYFRSIRRRAAVAVLLNGLDSICEVELHQFGNCLLARGINVLALDLPASLLGQTRCPMFDVETCARPLADWIEARTEAAQVGIGTFGVSFGGHLAARLATGDPRFVATIAVSPPAWLPLVELRQERLRRMFGWTFALNSVADIVRLAQSIDIRTVARPRSPILVYQMDLDDLFGGEHTRAFEIWGDGAVLVRHCHAEHVGTSQMHQWLPQAFDWMRMHLAIDKTRAA